MTTTATLLWCYTTGASVFFLTTMRLTRGLLLRYVVAFSLLWPLTLLAMLLTTIILEDRNDV